ncbi:Hsp70 family protein [Planktotalea arctica]|uniref:Hsp70 family protein n=1 Tax=Planktotalea arctica TaxID=1481893 RepID=UPI000A176A0E|nr:Hsp70 family protein [Planktotalea arctica]
MSKEQSGAVLAIDFGTSNSAVGVFAQGKVRLIELELGKQTLPTALFFDFEDKTVAFGSQAEQALFEGAWGRYMRALKSLLGTPLIRESGMFLGKRMSYLQIVARFLSEIKTRAECETGMLFTKALSGRPVRFHADEARDMQALADLREAYHLAGFAEVRFMNEPEAAARAQARILQAGDLGLVIDIGGGTSDFTLFRTKADGSINTLRSEGLRLGGTNFDRLLSFDHVMPLMGRGSQIRHVFGDQTHQAPNAIFADLATWQKIPFLYTPDTRRAAKDLLKYASAPEKLTRLVRVLDDERGHDLAFAVEAAKIALNSKPLAQVDMRLGALEKGLSAPLYALALEHSLQPSAVQIAETALACTEGAGVQAQSVTHLILVGGSSLMQVVQTAISDAFPDAEVHHGAALTGIIEGLAEASGEWQP